MAISEPVEITEPVEISEPVAEEPAGNIGRLPLVSNLGGQVPFVPVAAPAAPMVGHREQRIAPRGFQAVGEFLVQAAGGVGLGYLASMSAYAKQVPSPAIIAAWEKAEQRGVFSWSSLKASFKEYFDRSTAKANWLQLGGFVVAWTAIGYLFDRARRHSYNDGVDEGVRSAATALVADMTHGQGSVVSITRHDDNGTQEVILGGDPKGKISAAAPEGTISASVQTPTV
ncbi:MAG: hypothetical protein WDN72_07500 [Alphaproteobacteria bacterium]